MNILKEFYNELGYATATNQYIELAVRYFEKEHGKEAIEESAREINLSVSVLPEKYVTRIAKSYIVEIYSNIEKFLASFKELEGNPTERMAAFDSKVYESRLRWTLISCYGKNFPEEVKIYYNICNYYRLVRNEIVHMGERSSEYRNARSRVMNLDDSLLEAKLYQRLNAPNDVENIMFDDQVLFSRVARKLCERIYKDSQYDWNKILELNRKQIKEMVRKVRDCEEKRNQKIINYLMQAYPAQENQSLIETLKNFGA